MSASKEIFINCDGGSDVCVGDAFGIDTVGAYTQVAQVRKDARDNGWHFYKGEDYCPSCWEARKPKKQEQSEVKDGS